MTDDHQNQPRQRPTEPLPGSFKPAWIFMLCIAVLVAGIAVAAYFIDRAYYG